jgi:hypothetical protein
MSSVSATKAQMNPPPTVLPELTADWTAPRGFEDGWFGGVAAD